MYGLGVAIKTLFAGDGRSRKGASCFTHMSVLKKTQRRTHERKRSEAQRARAALRQPVHQPVRRLSGVYLPVGLRAGGAGAAWPEYQVQEPGRGVIGCEFCLVIRKGGAIQ